MKKELNEFVNLIRDTLENEESNDFLGVFITGDYFDKKLDLNDIRATYAIQVILELFEILQSANKWFVILRGTYSHDLSQLDFLKKLELSYSKFVYTNKVMEADLDGLNTLLIPEEYPTNVEEYYGEFFKKKYDLILGHGFFTWNCFDSNINEKSIPQMPIFDPDLFCEMSPLTIFGHDHGHKNYKEKIYYNGSFSRWSHNEEEPKGFLFIDYTKTIQKSGKVKYDIEVTHIENELAPLYITISIVTLIKHYKMNKDDLTLDLFVKNIESYIKKYNIYNLKIKIPSNTIDPKLTEVLKNYYSNKPNVIIEGSTSVTSKSDGNILEEDDNDETSVNSEYDFLFENDNIISKIEQFIHLKHGEQISISRDQISKALSI
jgi:hypothetical protein